MGIAIKKHMKEADLRAIQKGIEAGGSIEVEFEGKILTLTRKSTELSELGRKGSLKSDGRKTSELFIVPGTADERFEAPTRRRRRIDIFG